MGVKPSSASLKNAEIAQFLTERGYGSGEDRALHMAVFYADGTLTGRPYSGDIQQNSQRAAFRPISAASMSPREVTPNWSGSSPITSLIST